MVKIISYNVNGIRAATRKGWLDWLRDTSPDILCLQEVKAQEDQYEVNHLENLGYKTHWCPAVKKGYSGVAILSKIESKGVVKGFGYKPSDDEGRVLKVEFSNFSVMSIYAPSGASGKVRQAFKMEWLQQFFQYLKREQKTQPNSILAGDFNICHRPIDIHNPKMHRNSPGFLPEERNWMDELIKLGYIDSFRAFNNEPSQYTWWSYRHDARLRNLGWRIDYQLVSKSLSGHLKRAVILKGARHSDHCPILLEMDL